MLKKLLLVNSANFQIAEIDLSKEIFFVGDNVGGKTTSTRALHFLYNANGEQLGIPRGKDSFAKHYFADDDSYIIYVFDSFFIFTYKFNGYIRRWFCKGEFDLDIIINSGKLVSFKEIEAHIKSSPLYFRPTSIDEYLKVLYGQDKRYLDFSIAKIENYGTFLEVFNMIFNIDKAIVTASDIKKAIQKSLDRKDETLVLDYDDFIRKLHGFSWTYHFFKTFDSSRESLKNSLSTKDELLDLEKKIKTTQKAINYRHDVEIAEFNALKESIDTIVLGIKGNTERGGRLDKALERFEKRIAPKIRAVEKKIAKVEGLKEEFDPLIVEEKMVLANQYKGITADLDGKQFNLQSLLTKQSTAQSVLEKQIEDIDHKISTTIPRETESIIRSLTDNEQTKYENELRGIENEFEQNKEALESQIKEFSLKRDGLVAVKIDIDIEIENGQKEIIKEYDNKTAPLVVCKINSEKNVDEAEEGIRALRAELGDHRQAIGEHEKKHVVLRKSNARMLAEKRAAQNKIISNMRTIVNPPKNSLHEFFTNEIEGWEQEVYPVIDENLLRQSRDTLRPVALVNARPIGFSVDTSTLKTLPTKDEALQAIKKARSEKAVQRRNAKDVYSAEVDKFNNKKNELKAKIETCETKVNNLIDDKAEHAANAEKAEEQITTLHKERDEKIKTLRERLSLKKSGIVDQIADVDGQIIDTNQGIKNETRARAKAITDSLKNRDFNIKTIVEAERKKERVKIKTEEDKKSELEAAKKSASEDALISELQEVVKLLKKRLKESDRATMYLERYEASKEEIATLPLLEQRRTFLERLVDGRRGAIGNIRSTLHQRNQGLQTQKTVLEERHKQYANGIRKMDENGIEAGGEKLETETLLVDLVALYVDTNRDYLSKRAKFRDFIGRLKKLESHPIIELNFNMDAFDEAESILDLENVIESLKELADFERNKYDSEKKRSHNNFDSFLRNTIPSKLQSFDDLENEFEKAKASINKNLSTANFGVIRDIKLVTDASKKRYDSLSALLQDLSKKVQDTVGLYSSKSLFYQDVPKSVENLDSIRGILEEIKKRAAAGPINLFDTIDLSISYVENGKRIENKLNIKDESSSGGNIMLKVAIAMSILNRFAKKTTEDTPFFLIIDEVGKLHSKNQELIRQYINVNGFKTLFITPEPAYPDPKRAIYYTFKNIQEEGDTLEIRQMNIV